MTRHANPKTTKGPAPEPIVVWCDDAAKSEEVYNGLVDAVCKNIGELNVVVKSGDKQHFASLPIDDVFDLLHKVADAFAEDFNGKLAMIADAK